MRVTAIWTAARVLDLDHGAAPSPRRATRPCSRWPRRWRRATTRDWKTPDSGTGDPTEVAMLSAAAALGADVDAPQRDRERRHQFHFDPTLKLMSTVDERDGELWVDAKGAPEALLPHCDQIARTDGRERPLAPRERERDRSRRRRLCGRGPARAGRRRRRLGRRGALPDRASRPRPGSCFLGLVAMLDPPAAGGRGRGRALPRGRDPHHRHHRRSRAHRGGDRAAGRHRARGDPTIVTGAELDAMSEDELDAPAARADGADLRAQLARGQAAHRRRAARARATSSP